MEMNTFPLELLTSDNYVDWSVKMKNNLLAQGLWNIVEIGSKPPKPDDDVVEYEAWRKMNNAVLHAIQSSCGMDILSRINKISSAKIVWKTLAKMFTESNGQDKLIQTEDDERNSSSSDNTGTEREDDYTALVEAVRRGDWDATREFIELHYPRALTAKVNTLMGGTVLHAAVDAEHEHIVEELVNMISEHDLAMQDDDGSTALHVATISGNQRMAEFLIKKNKSLVSIRDDLNELPVSLAMGCVHKELARYLYSQTPFENLEADEGCHGASFLNRCFYHRDLDMALELMERCPRLAFALDHQSPHVYPLEVLANSTEAFEGGKGMVFWKQWIFNYCIHISLAHAADQFRLNIQIGKDKAMGSGIHISSAGGTDQVRLNIQNGQEKTIGPVQADRWRQLVSSLLNLLGFKHLYEMKLVQAQFQQLLSCMCQAIPTLNTSPRNQYIIGDIIPKAIVGAIRRGNFEFVYHIVKANPDLLWIADAHERRSIFHWAVLHRQHRIFSLIYNLKRKNGVLTLIDNSDNIILHMAGKLTKNTAIDQIRGAALQMQREVQWFKEVERIGPLSFKETLNKDGLTASQLFTRDHQEMRKEGERWMKDTATSCTVVGALIITIMFAAAFTIPGGNNQDTGLPILGHDKLFTLFIVTDSVSLFSSTTSVLMFMGILTSRYAEEDFLISLPKRMIIGLFALFISIATMMIAFSAALLLMLSGKYWIVVPIIGLAGVPIILFVLMQFRLLIDMLVSTYGSGIFDRKMKPWF